jgi:hypothetical protein
LHVRELQSQDSTHPMRDSEIPMRNTLKAATAAATFAAATAFAAAPALAQHMGGGHASGGMHATGGMRSAGGFHGARPGFGGWRGGWRGGWHGGWRGGWGCCGWRRWGWGPGFFWGGYPWFWGGLGFATGVALATPYYDDAYDYGYDAAPPAGDAPPPSAADNYNCSAWRWDAAQNKYVQVRAACS